MYASIDRIATRTGAHRSYGANLTEFCVRTVSSAPEAEIAGCARQRDHRLLSHAQLLS